MSDNAQRPTGIELHRASGILSLHYGDKERFDLDAEFLRVHSPSAEVRGHGAGPSILQTGKRQVAISNVVAAGNYALQLVFDDGHDSGIYSWAYLRDLCDNRERYWQAYLARLQAEGGSRDPGVQVIQL